ncbi:short chain dehydrogenase/reductase [Aspergillus steynii IBT 23096]|uniref:Short chain dehydrogenase/reductase n=1 Tax=Aspergillus steynii IBT 23096 TaxID=1392250 RepID=A0A2I2GEL5_9EURO|nr:short chain dehydrogenase/reductase [Aspergillus steynii IBT 23096]PLB51336.1 short chain dehydrogenase/reductase [Aspergillus steynii IBT 23096]
MAQRIVLITGANSGVGYATSNVFAGASSKFHIIMACRSLDNANAAKSEIEQQSTTKNTLSTIRLDVTDHQSIRDAASIVQEQFGRLDVLINNAGVSGLSELEDTARRMRLCYETNVVGPAIVSETFRPLLLKSPNPYSIYVTSGVGSLTLAADPNSKTYRGPAKGEAYRSSKSALNMVALQEWVEVQDQGHALKIFMMCPGFVRSNLRGRSEEARSGWGMAGDAEVPGRTALSIAEGERDADVGRFVHKDGVFPW